jgi:hypothetical protein
MSDIMSKCERHANPSQAVMRRRYQKPRLEKGPTLAAITANPNPSGMADG